MRLDIAKTFYRMRNGSFLYYRYSVGNHFFLHSFYLNKTLIINKHVLIIKSNSWPLFVVNNQKLIISNKHSYRKYIFNKNKHLKTLPGSKVGKVQDEEVTIIFSKSCKPWFYSENSLWDWMIRRRPFTVTQWQSKVDNEQSL